jgi:glycosyltransferase involved in cell wall biosynthesis
MMNMKKPTATISVVIPVYNEEVGLPHCLHSLQLQTLKPLEVIVVDNNSTDTSVEIAQKYGAKVISEHRQGISYTRTTGFNAARGTIIARLDADTIASPAWLQACQAAFEKHPNAVAISGRVATAELSPPSKFWFSLFPRISKKISELYIGRSPLLAGHNMAIKKSTWKNISQKVHLGDDCINEDVDLSLFAHSEGKVIYEPTMLVKTQIFELLFNSKKIMHYRKTTDYTVKLHHNK